MPIQTTRTARHVVALPTQADAPEWVHLIPAGSFAGRDGRGPFTLDADAVIAAFTADAMPLPLDYEHQSSNAPQNGQPAPAAGWITALEARDDGVWGRVEWTERGQGYVQAREYRFISPFFAYVPEADANDKEPKGGRVIRLFNAALTNTPNLHLTALNRREDQDSEDRRQKTDDSQNAGAKRPVTELSPVLCPLSPETHVQGADVTPDEFMERLRYLFNLPTLAGAAEIRAELDKLSALLAAPETAAMRQQLGLGETSGVVEILTTAHQRLAQPDPAGAFLRTEHEQMRTRLAVLEKEREDARVKREIDAALAAHKITPASREEAEAWCRQEPERFARFVAAQPAVVPKTSAHIQNPAGGEPIHPLIADAERRRVQK
jgi:phage I-like protein